MLIRPYDDADHSQVESLWDTVFPDSEPRNAPALAIALKRDVQRELFLVGVVDDRVVGTAMAGYDGHRGWLYLVAVNPATRRRGLGAALVREAGRRLRSLGCVKINLQVRSTSHEVVAFYEALGFAVEDRISMGKAFSLPETT